MNIQKLNDEFCEKCAQLVDNKIDSHGFHEVEVFFFGFIAGCIFITLLAASKG